MSVCDVYPEICRICRAVISKKEYRSIIFNHIERGNLRNYYPQEEFSQKERDLGNRMIYSWAERLYYANQMAQIMTYEETLEGSREILPLTVEEVDSSAPFRTPQEIWYAIGHIEYNLISNAGRMMIAEEDLKKLTTLKNHIAYSCIRRPEYV